MQNEEMSADDSAIVAERIVGKTNDIRDAVRVARMAKMIGVNRAIELLMQQCGNNISEYN